MARTRKRQTATPDKTTEPESKISPLLGGIDKTVPDEIRRMLNISLSTFMRDAADAYKSQLGTNEKLARDRSASQYTTSNMNRDTQVYTTISEMLNCAQDDMAGLGNILSNLYDKNKKYFSIIRDYEMMPILIPQITRVLEFLVNEFITPDIQNSTTFQITCEGTENSVALQQEIQDIKREYGLDTLLRDVHFNRIKLGREYYAVVNYNETFDRAIDIIRRQAMGESAGVPFDRYLHEVYSGFISVIDSISGSRTIEVCNESADYGPQLNSANSVSHGELSINLEHLNIIIEKTAAVRLIEEAEAEIIHERMKKYSVGHIFSTRPASILTEDATTPIDPQKLEALIREMRKKKLRRCSIERFDPAKMFRLKVGGRTIGYLYIRDVTEYNNTINFSQVLKDQIMKSRATNLAMATRTAEEIISQELAQKIIDTFDPSIGISRVEDIDLLHNFIEQNEVYKGNKKITFYYADEIFDLSRADDSILTNAVFFTKLYISLLMNNIQTKMLRGRGRQIHTIHMGASQHTQRYLQNAMMTLMAPEHNLGVLRGSFEQLMNAYNASSDVILPVEDDSGKFIETDFIPGQDVDMNDDTLKMLLNSIILSFGIDSVVIDVTQGNLQFARTWSMESLQVANKSRTEQQDLLPSWTELCLKVLHEAGSDALRNAIALGRVKVTFYEPKSLIVQNTIEDLENAKRLAEAVADITPLLNTVDNSDVLRGVFIYNLIKAKSNVDFTEIENILEMSKSDTVALQVTADKMKVLQDYLENRQNKSYDDMESEADESEESDFETGEPEDIDMGESEESEDTDTEEIPESEGEPEEEETEEPMPEEEEEEV